MKLGVVIERINYYRLLAPVVEAALALGWEVVAFHDTGQPRGGFKGSLFPATDTVPRFRRGAPRVTSYESRDHLVDAVWQTGVEAVLTLVAPPARARERPDVPWAVLQYSAELWRNLRPAAFGAAAFVGVYSEWWLEFALAHFRELGLTTPGDATERQIRAKAGVVGIPEIDQIGAIDPAEVRRRRRIPADRPVVLYLPYPFRSNPVTPWSRWVYPPGNPLRRRLRLRLAGAGPLEPLVMLGWDDGAVTRAVRAFCDASGAHLLVKARAKDPVPRYVRRVADGLLYDEAQYPATILELLAVADLCVHFYSAGVLEAVASGVPSLSICPALDHMGTTDPWQQRFFSRDEGNLFQFKGVAQTMGIDEVIESLPRLRLTDFATDPVARDRYAATFLGFSDRNASARLLSALRACADEARR